MPDTNAFGVDIPAAHSIGSYIDGKLSATPSVYQFPEDRPKYYTTITFEQFGASGAPGSIGGAVGATFEQLPAAAQGVIQSFIDTTRAQYNADVAAGRAAVPPAASQQTNETMILPLPVQLVDIHKVHWDEKSIIPWVSTLIGQTLAEPVQRVAGLFGLAPNFFQTILFDRPEYKRHELAFKLSPRTFRESTAIRDIIWVLNNAMSPSTEAGGFLFGFPNIVRVTLKPNNGWLFKFKPAVIETMAVNYAGGDGKKAFYHEAASTGPRPQGGGGGNNPPESVEITLHLVEVEYWIKGQFTQNNS